MSGERRGQAIRVRIILVNWQQEEPNGCGGERQLLRNGTSRVNREVYARFCERLGVKLPGPTRRRSAMVVPTATAKNRRIIESLLGPGRRSKRGWRWRAGALAVEECLTDAKGECSLDEYEVRSGTGWHRPVTLSLLAHAYLIVVQEQVVGKAPKKEN